MLDSLSFHNITDVRVKRVKVLVRSKSGEPFTIRDIILTNENGETFTVCLFGETHKDLVMHREK